MESLNINVTKITKYACITGAYIATIAIAGRVLTKLLKK